MARMKNLLLWALLALCPAAQVMAQEPSPAPAGEPVLSSPDSTLEPESKEPDASGRPEPSSEPAAPPQEARPNSQEQDYLPTMEDILAAPSSPPELQYETPRGWQEYGIGQLGRKSVELLGEAGKAGKEMAAKAAAKGAEMAVEAGKMGKDAAVKVAETGKEVAIKAAETGKEVAIKAAETGKEVAIKAAEKGIEVAKKAEKIIDEQHDWFSGEVETTAALVDAYFDNENAAVEGNKSQIKLSLSGMYEQGKDIQPGVGVDARIVLPRFEKRLHLILSSVTEETTSSEGGGKQQFTIKNVEEAPKSAAVRYFLLAMDTQNLSLDGGMNVKDFSPIFFYAGRYRLHVDMHPWDMRFTQWVRYYTDTKWETTTRLEFERLLNEAWLLRLAAESNWYHETEGYYYSAKAETYHTLNPESVLQYTATANFKSWPENRLTDPVLRAAHRRKIWREWFYVEGALQASWPEDRYFKFTPAVFLKIEGLFGNVPNKVRTR